MSERRGREIFLIFATLTILRKLGGTVSTLFIHGDRVDKPLAIVLGLSVSFPWRGTTWLQRLVGGTYLLSGARRLFDAGYSLALGDELDTLIVFGGILGFHGWFFATASSDFPIPLGWQGAGVEALIFAVVGTPVFGSAAFVLGAAITLLIWDGDAGKKWAGDEWSK